MGNICGEADVEGEVNVMPSRQVDDLDLFKLKLQKSVLKYGKELNWKDGQISKVNHQLEGDFAGEHKIASWIHKGFIANIKSSEHVSEWLRSTDGLSYSKSKPKSVITITNFESFNDEACVRLTDRSGEKE